MVTCLLPLVGIMLLLTLVIASDLIIKKVKNCGFNINEYSIRRIAFPSIVVLSTAVTALAYKAPTVYPDNKLIVKCDSSKSINKTASYVPSCLINYKS